MVGYQELLRQHDEIEGRIAMLEQSLEVPSGAMPAARLRSLLRKDLRSLLRAADAHFAAEEEGGYLAPLLSWRPDLKPRADRLLTQHRRILVSLESAVESAADTPPGVLCQEVAEILALFRQHEAAERALVQDATLQDLAAAD